MLARPTLVSPPKVFLLELRIEPLDEMCPSIDNCGRKLVACILERWVIL
jgi:hypothetical protein